MSEQKKPGPCGSDLSDELGRLPEPGAMTTRYELAPTGQGSAMSPVGTLRARGAVAVGYTAAQMYAYAAEHVAAERERCAEIGRAAQAVLDRWNSPKWEWRKQGPTADLMEALFKALKAQRQW